MIKAEVKLKESGLELSDKGFEYFEVPPSGITYNTPGIKIEYFDVVGRKTSFFRYRHLTESPERKYSQDSGSGLMAYLSPFVEWKELLLGITPLVVTEGEFKAACACKLGFPTIGIGGVTCWRNKDNTLVELLDQFAWKGREVRIIFDSDLIANQHVQKAQIEFAEYLAKMGARVLVGHVPASAKKMGIDDYLMEYGINAYKDYLESEALVPYSVYQQFHKLNEEVACIVDNNLVIRLEDGNLYTPLEFTSFAYSDRYYFRSRVRNTADGPRITRERLPLAKEWLSWPGRKILKDIVFQPGKAKIVDDKSYNLWSGWGCEAIEGDCKPFLKLIEHLFGVFNKYTEWFLDWLAYPLQHPGSKMRSAVLIWSADQGTGKSWLGYILRDIYGKNFKEITQAELNDERNTWAANAQFIMGEEITGMERREFEDRLKHIITRKELRVNPKYKSDYFLADCCNYYMTSNRPTAIYMTDSDRRFFIWHVEGHNKTKMVGTRAKLSLEFRKELGDWQSNGGACHLFKFLLDRDLSKFTHDEPLMTESKQDMLDLCRSELETFIVDMRKNPATFRKFFRAIEGPIIFTAHQLAIVYLRSGPLNDKVNAVTAAKAMSALLVPRRRLSNTQNKSVYTFDMEQWDFDAFPMVFGLAQLSNSTHQVQSNLGATEVKY